MDPDKELVEDLRRILLPYETLADRIRRAADRIEALKAENRRMREAWCLDHGVSLLNDRIL